MGFFNIREHTVGFRNAPKTLHEFTFKFCLMMTQLFLAGVSE